VHRGFAFGHRGFFFAHRRFVHRGFYPFYRYGYGCYRWRRVLTPYGWRLRRVNVCGYYRHRYYY
jgi:hypothetical protein